MQAAEVVPRIPRIKFPKHLEFAPGAFILAFLVCTGCWGQQGQGSVSRPSGILFAASLSQGQSPEDNKRSLASVDPVAIVKNGQLLNCFRPQSHDGVIAKSTLEHLRRTYSNGNIYPLWWGGSPFGKAEAMKSCIGEDDIAEGGAVDLEGCFVLRPTTGLALPSDFAGTVWTGDVPIPAHARSHPKATLADREGFRRLSVDAFKKHGVSVGPAQIRIDSIMRTQLRADHPALVGSALVQLPSGKDRIYFSFRLFLVAEESNGRYLFVLDHFHKATISLDEGTSPPDSGE